MNIDIEAIKRKMLVKYPFFGSVVANVDYRVNKNVSTAGTDGKIIHYNPEFLAGLSVSEQTFIFAHEVCHIAFNHILRSEGKNSSIWNIATDAVINAFLKRDGLHMVEGGVDMEDAINYDAEQLYEKLLKENQQQQQNGQSNKGQQGQNQQNQNGQGNSGKQEQNENNNSQDANSQSKNQNSQSSDSLSNSNSSENSNTNQKEKHQDVGHDTHSMWADAVKKSKEKQDKKEESKGKSSGNNNEEKQQREIEQKQEEAVRLGERESFKKNLEEKKKTLEELKDLLTKQSMKAGTTTNGDIRNVSNIGMAKPLIDWRYILKEAIKYDVDWSYQNATIENGVISANLEEQPIPETEIVLDTSGSINETLLKNFLRECKNILKHSRLKVGCFDTKFYGFNEIRNQSDIENMKFLGGGGTNFDAAVNAFTRRVENKIVFTDGEANMPNKPLDAIWIVFGRRRINPKGGRVIYITGEQLNRLYSYEQGNSYKVKKR